MASIADARSEKSNNFVDGVYDPDLESRLYAEIYYSNESYVTSESELRKDNNDASAANISTNETSSMPDSFSANNIVDCAVNSVCLTNHNQLQAKAFVYDRRPEYEEINESRNTVRNDLQNDCIREENERQNVKHQTINNASYRRQRLLACKNLWSRPEAREKRQRIGKVSNEQTERTENFFVDNCFYNNSNIVKQIRNTAANSPESRKQSATVADAIRSKRSCKLHERPVSKRKERKTNRIKCKEFRGTINTCRKSDKSPNNTNIDTDTSKYRVVGKKNKMVTETMDSDLVSISSDSEESILEVPVPPKALPPLINLNDSDEESSKLNEPCTNNNADTDLKEHCTNKIAETDDASVIYYSSESESSKSIDLFPLNDSRGESNKDLTNETPDPTVSVSYTATTNLILNCTQVQHGVANLDDIKKLRQTAVTSHVQSDDSMTESEVVNWNAIDACQAAPLKEKENYMSDQSSMAIDTELEHQSPLEDQVISSVTDQLQYQTLPTTLENSTATTTTMLTTECVPINSRKRHKSVESNSSKNVQAPTSAEKKMKRNSQKFSQCKALTEYFFEPMTTELQTFYNDPWGDTGDLLDIQSKMPRNPNFWAILDADLRDSPKSRGRQACPRCRTDSHIGRKCPVRPKKPNCHMCGTSGHTESRCPHTMCLTCGHKYTTYRQTCSFCYKLYCTICNGTGHKCDNCPDLWRRYHNTITETNPVAPGDIGNVMKAPQNLTCCNCAKRGHDVTMCRQLRWSQHFPTPIHVSSYTAGPTYYTTASPEKIGGVNDIAEVEIVEIPNDRISLDEHTVPTLGTRLLFQCDDGSNSSTTRYLHRTSLRLDEMTNVYLSELLAGNLKPTFLNLLKGSYAFSVRIIYGPDTAVYLNIETKCKDVLDGVEKLIRQWLSRNDNEKTNLVYAKISTRNRISTISDMCTKLSELNNIREPTVILQEIISLKKTIKNREMAGMRRFFDEKSRKRAVRAKFITRLKHLQSLLVASLYARSFVDGATEIVESFRQLIAKVKKSNQLITKHHLELVYLYNEIFTFRTTGPLSIAFVRLFSKKQLLQLLGPNVDKLTWTMGESTVKKLGHNDANGSYNESGSQNQICSVYYSPLGSQYSNELTGTIGQNSPKDTNLICTSVPHLVTGNDKDSNNCQDTELRFANYFDKASSSFNEKMKNDSMSKLRRKNIHHQSIFTNLTKTASRALRKSVRETIKAAKKLQIQSLNEMANVLKRKLNNSCVSANDIELFKKTMMILQSNQANEKVKKSTAGKAPESELEQQNTN